MRVVVDARPLSWGGYGGIKRVNVGLLEELSQDPRITAMSVMRGERVRKCWSRVVGVGQITHALHGMKFMVWDVRREAKRFRADVVLSLSPEPVFCSCPVVMLFYDSYSLHQKSWLRSRDLLSWPYWFHWGRAKLRVHRARSMDAVVLISEAAGVDVLPVLGRRGVASVVAHPGVAGSLYVGECMKHTSSVGRPGSGNQDHGFFLYFGAVNRHKNIQTLVEGFRRYREDLGGRCELVICGGVNWPVFDVSIFDRYTWVQWLGNVSDEELRMLLSHCIASVNVSFAEGFGLPVLEAMSCGKPVIVGRTGAFIEVVGDGGIFVDPFSAKEIADALLSLDIDAAERRRLGILAKARAESFSWSVMSDKVVSMLCSVVGPIS